MRDEALDAAQRLRKREALEAVEESAHVPRIAGELEAHHRAVALLLTSRDRMTGMRRETGIMHAAHGRVSAQQLDDGARIALVLAHAQLERADAAQREVAVEGRARHSETIRPPGDLRRELLGA